MRKSTLTIEMIRNKMEELVGKNINMEVCRGRKQIKRYTGIIECTYPSVFVVRLIEGDMVVPTLSYSYSDILCGEVIVEAT